ncbi:P-loop containing nucleoside triphosphate hydrolase protein [Xylariomycetidae sp. FL2044]|nr:P-loop containing nucleoside triphosphate hydrolase protein [Xylariomycetidae sp. FL2044]
MATTRPVFVLTHPRACSTAFERVFMTRRDILECAHEPFGDAFYYGPERLSDRYANDEDARQESGFSKTTYRDVFNRLERDGSEGKRVFVKDMAYYLMPPDGKPPSIAPSLRQDASTSKTNGDSGASANGVHHHDEPGNPTVVPRARLEKFHWTFLIRHPRRGIPSFLRCCVPPLDDVTGFKDFMANEAGYAELRRLFDYLREQGIVGPQLADHETEPVLGQEGQGQVRVTVIDADDLLDHPEPVVRAFCRETGIPFDPDMLKWGDDENQKYVSDAFAKWIGFHNDAINSTCLAARTNHHATPTEQGENEQWREKYGEKHQKVIRDCVDANVPDYEYLKSFALKF